MRIGKFRLFVLLIMLVGAALTTLGLLVSHLPAFYVRCEETPGNERAEASNDFFLREFAPFITNFKEGRGAWSVSFTQRQLNSFFEEHFVRFGDADQFRKIGITDPRMEFEDDCIRLGFRYGEGGWSTILNYDLRIWVASTDVNVLVVEFLRCRAGALPAPTQRIFRELTELGRAHNIDVNWFRHHGNAVAVVKFQSDRARPTAQLRAFDVAAGKLTIRGVSIDPTQTPIEEPIRTPPKQVSQQ